MNPIVNTAHVVNGALVLGTSLILSLRAFPGARVPGFHASSVRRAEVLGSEVRGSRTGAEARP
jgi:hypothetical protein